MAMTPSQVADVLRVRIIDRTKVARTLRRAADVAPRKTLKAVGRVAQYWAGWANQVAPTRATRKKSERGVAVVKDGRKLYPPFYNPGPRGGGGTGRGHLKGSTMGRSFMRGSTVVGLVYNYMPYAGYIEFGTQRIAGGRVQRWTPGQPPIREWLWKIRGKTNPLGQMPFIRPFIPKALDRLERDIDSMLALIFRPV